MSKPSRFIERPPAAVPLASRVAEPSRHVLERPPYAIAPPADTLGLYHVAEALRDLPWPATVGEIRARAGHWRMPITGNHFHRLDEFLVDVDEDVRFRSVGELTRAIGRAHPGLRP